MASETPSYNTKKEIVDMKITNTDLNIKEKVVMLGDKKVLVKQYLETDKKSKIFKALGDLCFGEQILDQPKIDALFNAFIILNYTNIEFDSRDVYDLLKFYDYMESNNYTSLILQAIPEIEYNALIGYYKSTISDYNRFKVSTLATFASIVEHGPELIEKISKLSKEIDMDAIKTVANIFAKTN